jgi:hypothetical protein
MTLEPRHKCPRCGRLNHIVNQCGCDPANLPTKCNLVEVRDVYDRLYYVDASELASSRAMLRVYHGDGRRRMFRVAGGSAADWQGMVLARANICPHDRATWIAYRFPDGTPGDYCPVCAPIMVDSA